LILCQIEIHNPDRIGRYLNGPNTIISLNPEAEVLQFWDVKASISHLAIEDLVTGVWIFDASSKYWNKFKTLYAILEHFGRINFYELYVKHKIDQLLFTPELIEALRFLKQLYLFYIYPLFRVFLIFIFNHQTELKI
jgi:hypothetical protein